MNIHYIVATDNFPGIALSGNYTVAEGGFAVAANVCTGTNTVDSYAFRNSETYSPDQYSKSNISVILQSSNNYVEQIVRWSGAFGVGAGQSGYLVYTDGANGAGNTAISKWVNDVQTDLQSLSPSFVNGSDILIEVIGNNLFVYKNGVRFGSNQTDNSNATGKPGIGAYTGGAFNTAEFGNVAYPFMLNKPDALRSQITR